MLESNRPAAASELAAERTASELHRRHDRVIGLVIVAVAFALCLVLSWWAKER
jgi:DNA-binding transcriptional regulator of glucitol operon